MIKVIGVGDNVVDRHLYINTMYPGGNSVNFAVYARQMGHESAYTGVLADDPEGQLINNTLTLLGVDTSHSTFLAGGETGRCSIRLVNGDRIITDDNDLGSVKSTPLQITDDLLSYIGQFDVAHSSCYSFIEDQLIRIKNIGVPVVYDFSDCWEDKDLENVCPSIDIAFMSGKSLPDEEIRQYLAKAIRLGCSLAISTIGKRGAIVYDGANYYTKAPYNLGAKVVDTLGAGDSFLTGFTTTYIEGLKKFRELSDSTGDSCTTTEDFNCYRTALISYSMEAGNLLAIKNCMVSGAFGHGAPIEDE